MLDTSVEMPHTEEPPLVPKQGLKALSLVLLGLFSLLSVLPNSAFTGTEFLAVSSSVELQWIEVNLPSLPALADHEAVVVETEFGETVCVIGGRSRQAYCYLLGATGALDGAGGEPAYSLGEALSYHAATVVGNRIYVLGGLVESGFLFREKVYCVERDTNSGRWIPHPGGVMKKKVVQHAAVTVGNRIYVIGGCDNGWNYLADVWSADVGSGCITLSRNDWRPEKLLRTRNGNLHKVSGHAAVSPELYGKRYIYVIGGMTASRSPTNIVLRAEVGSNGVLSDWDDLGAVDGMSGTWLLTAVVSGRYLYILGGTTSPTAATSSDKIYRARIEDNGDLTWLDAPQDLPIPLHAHAATVSKHGRLYIVGGISNGVRQDKLYFTPLLHFEKLATPGGSVTHGDTINYTLKLTNLGVRDFESLLITDTVQSNVPTALEFHGLPDECRVYSDADDTITCTVPNLELGKTKDLDFEVTIFQPTPASFSAPNSFHAPLATSAPHITWTQTCALARLEVLGVGIGDSLTDTLCIPSPETITSDSIRAQVVLKIPGDTDEKVAAITFCSGGICYPPLTVPTPIDRFMAVYEQDVQVSDAISVTVVPIIDGVQEDALTAYFLRSAKEGHSLVGRTMNHALYHDAYTQVLTLPLPVNDRDIIVQAVLADNDPDLRPICLTARAGGVSDRCCFTKPSHGNRLDIRELRLSGVPTGTTEVTVIAESPPENGDSLGLIGLVAETQCTPLRVVNKAEVCEVIGSGQWCMETGYINTELHVYLPIVSKNAP